MPSIYQLKPQFQALLRPIVMRLASAGVTANQVTLSTCLMSVLAGVVVFAFGDHYRVTFWLLPVVLFTRMALNAIDGMLAREHNMRTRLGAVLNELTDVISDVALYAPFVELRESAPLLVGIVLFLTVMTEFSGLLAQTLIGERRYDGPMGKSDRAFAFGLLAVLLALGLLSHHWLLLGYVVIVILLIKTTINRLRPVLRES